MSITKPEGTNAENEEEERLFLNSLGDHIRRNTGLELGRSQGMKIPKMCGLTISLYSLYTLVREGGGFDRVTETKGWRHISRRLIKGESPTNSGYIIRNHYERLLLSFEREESKTFCTRHSPQAASGHKRPISNSLVGFEISNSTAKRMRAEGIEIHQGPVPVENRTDLKGTVAASYETDVPIKATSLGIDIANKGGLSEKLTDTLYRSVASTTSRKERKSGSQSTSFETNNKRAKPFPFRRAFLCGLCRKDCFDTKELGPQVRIDWLNKGASHRYQPKLSMNQAAVGENDFTWPKGDLGCVHGHLARLLPNLGPMVFLEPWYEEIYEVHLEHFLGLQNTKADRTIALNILTMLSSTQSTKWYKRLFLPRLVDICERYLYLSRKQMSMASRSRGKPFSEIADSRYGLLDEHGCLEVDDFGIPQKALNPFSQRWWECLLFSVGLETESCILEEAKAALLILSNVTSSPEEAEHIALDTRFLKLLFSFAEDTVCLITTMGIDTTEGSAWGTSLEITLTAGMFKTAEYDMEIYWEALTCLQNLASKLDLLILQERDDGFKLVDRLIKIWEGMLMSTNVILIRYCCIQIATVVERVDMSTSHRAQSLGSRDQNVHSGILHDPYDTLKNRIANDTEKKRMRTSDALAKIAKLIPYLLQSLELDEEMANKCLGTLRVLSKGGKKTIQAMSGGIPQFVSILEKASLSQEDSLIVLNILNTICLEDAELWSSLEERLVNLSLSTAETSKLASKLLLWRSSPSTMRS